MGRVGVILLLVVMVLALWAGASRASSPVVPLTVQHAIEMEHARIAFFPSRLPPGYRYGGWQEQPVGGYMVVFNKRDASGTVVSQLSFVVTNEPCSTNPGTMTTFRMNGRTIRASWTNADRYAWICLKTHRGRPMLITAANAAPRIDALLVAYAEPADI